MQLLKELLSWKNIPTVKDLFDKRGKKNAGFVPVYGIGFGVHGHHDDDYPDTDEAGSEGVGGEDEQVAVGKKTAASVYHRDYVKTKNKPYRKYKKDE